MKLWNFPDDPVQQCGYGPASTRLLQKLVGMPEPFLDACLIHDNRYGHQTSTRAAADKELLDNMLARSYSLWDKARAYLFYGAVRLLGGPIWRDK